MMHNKSIIKMIAAAIGLALSIPAASQAGQAPADFGSALGQISSQVDLPQTFPGGHKTLAVYCQTDVSTTGHLDNTICYQHPNIANLQQQTLNALHTVTFEPATVGGDPVPVRMQFRVVFSVSGDQPQTMLLANLGTLQGQYGLDYYAPQERLEQRGWYERYANNSWAKGKPFFNEGRLTRVMATVDKAGKVTSVSTLDARGSGKRDANFIEDILKQSSFIPGIANQQPTEMHYVAVLNYAAGED